MFDMNRRLEYNKYIKFILLAKQWKRCDAKLKGLKITKYGSQLQVFKHQTGSAGQSGCCFFAQKQILLNFIGKFLNYIY
jgi:hypothetical protein